MSKLDQKGEGIDAVWKAAKLYCQVPLYGIAEGLYLLGMLYMCDFKGSRSIGSYLKICLRINRGSQFGRHDFGVVLSG